MILGSCTQNSAPNVDEELSPPLNFSSKQKQWQITHSPLLQFTVEQALVMGW